MSKVVKKRMEKGTFLRTVSRPGVKIILFKNFEPVMASPKINFGQKLQ